MDEVERRLERRGEKREGERFAILIGIQDIVTFELN